MGSDPQGLTPTRVASRVPSFYSAPAEHAPARYGRPQGLPEPAAAKAGSREHGGRPGARGRASKRGRPCLLGLVLKYSFVMPR
jgi:hypothetical protein